MKSVEETQKSMGLLGATGVGVGAIVGGGILALAGAAFAATGPSAILAFGLNGAIAFLTVLSFSEMASKFPESGGTYTFSRKVLSVEAAFTVGWVVWFASVVAAVLYALGFAHFSLVMVRDLGLAAGWSVPPWITDGRLVPVVAVSTTIVLTLGLMLTSAGGGPWINIAKIAVFGVLVLGGFWAMSRQSAGDTQAALRPFLSSGFSGLFQAMGYSFIALQGFDLIAAVGGEVKDARKTVPRAMILSLAIALAIYLPLLLVITAVGVPSGDTISEVAKQNPEDVVAVAARNFLGPAGYWLVITAAVLSMFTALQANLYAASRIALAMSKDHTLPSMLSKLSVKRGVPTIAIAATSVLVCALLLVLPDVAAAGAAASLIFLMTFAIAHGLAMLVRVRSSRRPPPFRSPAFPLVPVVGGCSCVALAVFQGVAVPMAGTIAVVWISIGGILFLSLFARRARLQDVSAIAADPELLTLRGHSPLVLVPIANPQNAQALIALAAVLVPSEVGRVLIQSVVVAPENWRPDQDPSPIANSPIVLRDLLAASARVGIRIEALATVATDPMEEIARVAHLHRCDSVLLGLSEISEGENRASLEDLLSRLDTDAVVLRAPGRWQLSEAKNILVPVAGRGGHDHLLTRLLGSLSREQKRRVTFVRTVPTSTSTKEYRSAQRDLKKLARDNLPGQCETMVIRSDDPVTVVAEMSEHCGLMILGIRRIGPHEKVFGSFTLELAERISCPIVVLSRQG